MMTRGLRLVLTICLLTAPLAGCVYYGSPPPSSPPVYDRAWSAAVGGMQDAGVQILSADQASGFIRGTKDGIEATATVVRQVDGSVRVQFDTKGPTQRDPDLHNRMTQAYNRRMGR